VPALFKKICLPRGDSWNDQIQLVKGTGVFMSMTDPLADMFTRIRNGSKAKFEKVDVPASKMKREIAKILKEEGFIKNLKVVTDDQQHEILRIFLKYDANRKEVIHLRRISKPGRRVYVGKDRIPSVMSGLGLSILSTPKGILADKSARMANVGGEVLCYVW
jgi:small subunit ribosomal protein S8